MTKTYQIQFKHKTGKVVVNDMLIGEYRSPDPSGAPWARPMKWIFTAYDGRVTQHDKRMYIEDAAIAAYRRRYLAC